MNFPEGVDPRLVFRRFLHVVNNQDLDLAFAFLKSEAEFFPEGLLERGAGRCVRIELPFVCNEANVHVVAAIESGPIDDRGFHHSTRSRDDLVDRNGVTGPPRSFSPKADAATAFLLQ